MFNVKSFRIHLDEAFKAATELTAHALKGGKDAVQLAEEAGQRYSRALDAVEADLAPLVDVQPRRRVFGE